MSGKLSRVRWGIPLSILGFCILFSCIDSVLDEQNPFSRTGKEKSRNKNKELTLSVARQWYQTHYDPVVTTRSVTDASNQRLIMPDWEKGAEMHRGRYEVVELPMMTKGSHLILDAETALKWDVKSDFKFIRNTAKLVIEKDKKTGRVRSFIMIFVGSYDYLSKRRTIGKNTYLYRQPDFDGSVLFYALNGTLVNGWKYEKGKIVGTISSSLGQDPEKRSVQTRAWVEECYDECITYYDEFCTETPWAEPDAEYGFVVGVDVNCIPITTQECNTVCRYVDDGMGDSDDNWEKDNPTGESETSPLPSEDIENEKEPEKYVEKEGNVLAKENLPQQMNKQFKNGCVPSIMQYVDNNLFGGTDNEGVYAMYYFQKHGEWIYDEGVLINELNDLVNYFFNTTDFTSYKDAIDAGYAVMTDIPSTIDRSSHNILVIGYEADGDLIYMDPEKGEWNVVNESYLKGDYNYVLTGKK